MDKRQQNSNEENVNVMRNTHLSNSECKMEGGRSDVKYFQHEILAPILSKNFQVKTLRHSKAFPLYLLVSPLHIESTRYRLFSSQIIKTK